MRMRERIVRRLYVTAFSYSWGVWVLMLLYGHHLGVSGPLAVSIGGAGPVIAVVLILSGSYDKSQRALFFSSLFDLRRIRLGALAIALLLPPVSILAGNLLAGEGPVLLDPETLSKGILYVLFLLFFGPVPEELAWRGIAFERLSRRGRGKAQLTVALLWALWHLPLLWIEGSYQHSLLGSPLLLTTFFVNIISTSMIYGYLYLVCGRSILIAIIFHYSVNLSGELLQQSPTSLIYTSSFLAIAGIVSLYRSLRSTQEPD